MKDIHADANNYVKLNGIRKLYCFETGDTLLLLLFSSYISDVYNILSNGSDFTTDIFNLPLLLFPDDMVLITNKYKKLGDIKLFFLL